MMTPAKSHVTQDECDTKHETLEAIMKAELKSIAGRCKMLFWALGFSVVTAGGILGSAWNTAHTAMTTVDDVRSRLETSVGDVKGQVQSQVAHEEEFKVRIVKALDETRTEMRLGDQRIDGQLQIITKGQQEMMGLLVQIRQARNGGE
jgi:hypothetical protein